ncbi:glycosyltransferase [Dysgonomonas sp. 216]|uniref:glycosyltransferase family 2 protein n=1 Tax=Dysgonomonas sp. 216 TaxID=2302934 RepID=UPI0013D2E52A|nr:glycosyltransferase [Dysgonomonas sp. 216]NDW18019.1 glycosyltransferase [Dysgonomonas sp. 216]
MISICIPIYNYDARKLVNDLHAQAEQLKVEYEIVLLDDVSDAGFKDKNRPLTELGNVRYIENPVNIGSSRMRNELAKLAKYPYLLIVDSDAVVTNADFLRRYIVMCQPNVVCFGGCMYTDICPDKKYMLRWKFGKKREEGVGKYYSCFNILIYRDLLLTYPFSDDLKNYGYEEDLFGARLKYAGVEMSFIDNPLLHAGLEVSESYLKKINLSLGNLLQIEPELKNVGAENSIKLLKAYYLLKKFYLTSLFRFFFRIVKGECVRNLKGENPQLFVLDFYKLGRFCELKASANNGK